MHIYILYDSLGDRIGQAEAETPDEAVKAIMAKGLTLLGDEDFTIKQLNEQKFQVVIGIEDFALIKT